ncbi:MAG: hypothetical protein COA42_16330 [Alteromonadaceae bacterium]|nr:MAG: hypothetical protein COA42_16330 [Alteromonadaceae bacterium]
MNVLVIEPSRSMNAVISSILSPLGVCIKQAASIKRAKFIVENISDVDFVVMGSELEDGTAKNLIKYLRQLTATSHSPVYLLTSNDDHDAYAEFLGKGITEVFQKNKPGEFFEFLKNKVMYINNKKKVHGNILYIEDSEFEAILVEDYLTDSGFTVDTFDCAEDALTAFEEKTFDLVLSDILLKGKMSGLRLLLKIRSLAGSKSQIPFIAMSSSYDEVRKVELLSEGANDFIAKPALCEELVARVTNLVLNQQLKNQVEVQRKELESLAMLDQLTGLYNRNYLFRSIPEKISESIRHKYDSCLLVVDIDKFKLVNDTYGHAVGDKVLTAVANAILKCCRDEDVVARFGGEEFVVLLSHCDYVCGLSKAEEIRKSVEILEPEGLTITASFGVTSIQSVAKVKPKFEDLFKLADSAVYKAKDNGRNCVVGSNELPKSAEVIRRPGE